jgi:hypothetical protein
MLGHDIAMADAPVVLQAHQADAAFACQFRSFRQRELALRLG